MGIQVPTREEMKDIEPSELLYVEDGDRYMTGAACSAEVSRPEDPGLAGITFILRGTPARHRALRGAAAPSGCTRSARAGRPATARGFTGEIGPGGLIETVIDRAADVLQLVRARRIDRLSGNDLRGAGPTRPPRNTALQDTLRALGRHGDLISKQRESLVSIGAHAALALGGLAGPARRRGSCARRCARRLRDLQSLEEHATFLSTKIQFLLDATLGLVNLEQNNIIKLFSVMAVVFMPPTLIASIYGMNFKTMPELELAMFGYPMAIGLMIVAAVLPYLFFRWKRWL